jgi:hypothetical protein
MYKISIEDTVEVNVKFTLKAGKVNKQFACTLVAKRMGQDEITERLQAVEYKFVDFMLTPGLITDWRDQRLVVDEAGAPAEFNEDAFTVMLKTQGLAQLCFNAYQKEAGAKEKN